MKLKINASLRVSLAAVAAIVGAGFATGREIMVFFTGQGAYSWIGIVIASAGIGFLCGMIAHFALKTGAKSFPAIYGAEMGGACEGALQGLYGLLMLVTASVMLAAGAELGALALPFHHAELIGIALTLLAALLATRRNSRAMSVLGALLVPFVIVFYVAMAMDSRPAPVSFPERTAYVYGSIPLAAVLGLLYAALNAAMAGGIICLTSKQHVEPRRVGLYTGLMLMGMLSAANAALYRAGPDMRNMALPAVILSARFGVAGFYLSILLLWSAVITTLCAALGSFSEQAASMNMKARPVMVIFIALALMLAFTGFMPLVEVGYPILGWSCAIALLALIAFL